MQSLWKIKRLFKGYSGGHARSKATLNTVATLLKILIDKDFVTQKPFGRMHQYEPMISREQCIQKHIELCGERLFRWFI